MSELVELAQRYVDLASGGEEIEIVVSRGVDTEVVAYDGALEKLAVASSAGVGFRVLIDGSGGARIGSGWAGSLEEEAAREALASARENARYATEDEFVAFARPDGVSPADLSLRDESVLTTPLDDKVQMALDLESSVRRADRRVRQVESANYTDFVSETVVMSSVGVTAVQGRSGAYLSVSAIANDGGDDETGWGLSMARAPGDVSVDRAARDAVSRATGMLGSAKSATMKCPAVFDSRAAAVLLAIVGGALSGDAVARGRSLFENRVGELVASPLISLVDDPTDPRHFAASSFDGEGLACRRTELIRQGQLVGFVYDTYAARRAGTRSTGGALRAGFSGSPSAGCRALQLVTGEGDRERIVRDVGSGIYVESLMGVHSGVNPVSGDFSVGVAGYLIEGGQLTQPVRGMTVASTLQRLLSDVTHVGDDVQWLPGTAAGATLAFSNVTVSGD